MTTKALLIAAFILIFALPGPAPAGEMPAAEKARIEALLAHIQGLTGAKFIRNGSDYDPATAVKFLRGKWQTHEKEIKTAADFIAIAATRSSTSGKPYMIRLKDAAPTPCAEYLAGQLKKLASPEER